MWVVFATWKGGLCVRCVRVICACVSYEVDAYSKFVNEASD